MERSPGCLSFLHKMVMLFIIIIYLLFIYLIYIYNNLFIIINAIIIAFGERRNNCE